MVAHELQCLLCKLPVECRKGATDLLQQHLRRDHEVVRYEVDLLLHLCLASRAEKEEIIKLLSPRMDWFVEKGEVENDINLFETASKEESSLNATEFHSFAICDLTQSEGRNPGVESINKVNESQVVKTAGEGETGKVEKGGSVGRTIEELAYFVQSTHSEGTEEINGDEVSCRAPREGQSSSEEGEQNMEEDESENLTLVLSNDDDDVGESGSEEVRFPSTPAVNLAHTPRKDDTCAGVGGGDVSEEKEQMCLNRGNVTLGEEADEFISSPDNTSPRETFAMNKTDVITSTPMVTVKRQTLAEVNTSKVAAYDVVDRILFEETVIEEEEGGRNHDSLRAIPEKPKATMVAESRNENVTFDLSRLSETNINEVGDASDETWLLSSSSGESPTVKAMFGAGDTSGAKALRSRSDNKDNTFEGVASARCGVRLRKVSMADANQTFVREGGQVPCRGQDAEDEENMEEEVNTTYSLADVSLTTRSAAKRKREEEQKEAKEKEGRKRRSPRSRKPILC